MSHQVESMAFVGQVPWWGIGKDLQPGDTIVDKYPDMSTNALGAATGRYLGEAGTCVTGMEMLKGADLDWRVNLKPATVMLGSELRVVPDQFVVVRDFDGSPLSVVGNKYTTVQNADLFAVPDVLVREGHVSYETAGSLEGGRKVWALLRWGHQDIRRGGRFNGLDDRLEQYLLWMGSHDGSSAVLGGLTFIRVVCKNTADAAMGVDGKRLKNRVSIRHTASAPQRMAEAHRTFLELHAEAAKFTDVLQQLADTPMNCSQMRAFAQDWLVDARGHIVQPVDPSTKERELYELRKARREWAIEELVSLFGEGKGNQGSDKYDAYNACTEWLDHKRGQYDAVRTEQQQQQHLHSTLVGDRYKQKGKALKLLTRW